MNESIWWCSAGFRWALGQYAFHCFHSRHSFYQESSPQAFVFILLCPKSYSFKRVSSVAFLQWHGIVCSDLRCPFSSVCFFFFFFIFLKLHVILEVLLNWSLILLSCLPNKEYEISLAQISRRISFLIDKCLQICPGTCLFCLINHH